MAKAKDNRARLRQSRSDESKRNIGQTDDAAAAHETNSRAKVALVGDVGVGKTSLAQALVGREFEPTESTHRAQLWSMNSALGIDPEELLLDPRASGHRGLVGEVQQAEISAALVIVDSRSDQIEAAVRRWSKDLNAKRNPRPFKKILVVSRMDVGELISDDQLVALARSHGFDNSFLTSAYQGAGIQELRDAIREAARWYANQDSGTEDEVEVVVRALSERLCELVAKNPEALDRIEWRDLERIVATSLRELGFNVELTPPAKDGGKDVVANLRVGKERRVYYVEIKHWRSGRSPGPQDVTDFVEVNVRDNTQGGLFLSSSGFTVTVLTRLGQITRQRVRLGGREKIVHLCQQFVRKRDGLWRVDGLLPDLLFAETIC